jgi:hypothetical protein
MALWRKCVALCWRYGVKCWRCLADYVGAMCGAMALQCGAMTYWHYLALCVGAIWQVLALWRKCGAMALCLSGSIVLALCVALCWRYGAMWRYVLGKCGEHSAMANIAPTCRMPISLRPIGIARIVNVPKTIENQTAKNI